MTTFDDDTDRLVSLAAAGDHSARDRLFARHRDRLKRMVAVRMDEMLRARLDPSDVVQEAYLEVSRRLAEYDRTRAIPFYPWLRQIAWERLVELHRWHFRKKRTVVREQHDAMELSDESFGQLADGLAAGQSTPSGRMLRRELVERVKRAMSNLDADSREILVLRHLEQLSVSESAAVLGVSVSAAKSRHFRAMQRLVRELEQCHHE
jgi:RNA polymerase sigma-70 factor (ECF subfamily)